MEAQIREKVLKYQEETGDTFTIEGKPLLQLMKDDWENRKAVSVAKFYENFFMKLLFYGEV